MPILKGVCLYSLAYVVYTSVKFFESSWSWGKLVVLILLFSKQSLAR